SVGVCQSGLTQIGEQGAQRGDGKAETAGEQFQRGFGEKDEGFEQQPRNRGESDGAGAAGEDFQTVNGEIGEPEPERSVRGKLPPPAGEGAARRSHVGPSCRCTADGGPWPDNWRSRSATQTRSPLAAVLSRRSRG